MVSKADIQRTLENVKDPEIPVLTIEDLGIIREVEVDTKQITVTITPTYSGCPAMDVIESDIKNALAAYDLKVEVKTVLHPAWTTDWISKSGREKLREYGIAPPVEKSADKDVIMGKAKTIPCPFCASSNTIMKSQFGSTPCKALYFCKDCIQPFDYFKCL